MISRRGLPLRWRAAALTTAAIVLLALVASVTAFWVVGSALRSDLQQALATDAERVASLYRRGSPVDGDVSLSGPTGRVTVQLYGMGGELLAASDPAFEGAAAQIPAGALSGAADRTLSWRGTLAGRTVQAAIAGFGLGYVAVVADTGFIRNALARLGRALLVSSAIVIVVAGLLGYLVAGISIRPIAELAGRAADRGPARLDPIELHGPRDEVAQLTDTLNDLMRRLADAMDAQRAFLAETSHELRTPLTSLRGFLERAHRKADPDVRRELADARRVAGTLSRLVEDLLQLSRGQLVRELTPHLVDPLEDLALPVAEEFPGVAVDGTAAATVLGDPERLRQLLRNLVANAVRAAGSAAEVTVRVSDRNGLVELGVTDTGPGIAPDVLPRIFDKFYKGAGGGSGLGLAIARQIVEHHGGEIAVDSRPGLTTFRVTLPAVEGEG